MDNSYADDDREYDELMSKPDVFIKSENSVQRDDVVKYLGANKRFKGRIWGWDTTETLYETNGFKWYDYELEGYKNGEYALNEEFLKTLEG